MSGELEYKLNFEASGVDQVKGVASVLKLLGNSPDLAWLGSFAQQIQQATEMVNKMKAGFAGLGVATAAMGAGAGAIVLVTRALNEQREEIDRLAASLWAARDAYDNVAAANARRFRSATTKEENDALVEDLREQVRVQKQNMASNPGKTKEERDNQRQILFNLENQLKFAEGRNLPTRAEAAAAEEKKADMDPARAADLRDRQERDINEEQRRRGFDLQFASAGEGGVGATNRINLLQAEEERLSLEARRLDANSRNPDVGARELAEVQAQILAIERQRSSIMLQILREEENLAAAKKDYEKSKADAAREKAKTVAEQLGEQIKLTQDRRDFIAGMTTGIDTSNVARIGGSVGGEAAAAANYQRRMTEGIGRMVSTLDKLLAAMTERRDAVTATWGGES